MDSGGFHRTPDIPLESRYATGFHWFPPESGNSTGFHWCPVDLLSGKSPDGFHGLRWNMPVSSGLRRTPPGINMPIWLMSHQDIPGFESGGFREFPAEHVGECTVLEIRNNTNNLKKYSQMVVWARCRCCCLQ